MASTSPNIRATIDWNAVEAQRRQIRLDQGDRRRRPADEKFAANWAGREGGRHSARRLSFRLLVPSAERGSRPGSSRTCRSRTTPCRPVLDVEATPTSQTCQRHLERDSAIADMKVMLDEMERHYGTPAGHLHQRRLLRGDPVGRRLHRLSDLGALDQASSRPCAMARANGISGNIRPTARSPGIDGHVDQNAYLRHAASNGRRSSTNPSDRRTQVTSAGSSAAIASQRQPN